MKVLITGIDGFLGRHAQAYFSARGARIYGLGRPRQTGDAGQAVIRVQLGDDRLKDHEMPDVDAVIHLATPAHVHPQGDADDWGKRLQRETIDGTAELINWIRPSNAKLVFISSIKAKEVSSDDLGYAKAKSAAEHLALTYENAAVLRLPIVVGPKMKGQLVKMIALAQKGVLPALPTSGDARPLIDVRDVLSAIDALLRSDIPGAQKRVWEISDGHSYSLHDVSVAIRSVAGARNGVGSLLGPLVGMALAVRRAINIPALSPKFMSYFDEKIVADTAAFSEAFDWHPAHDLRSALHDALYLGERD